MTEENKKMMDGVDVIGCKHFDNKLGYCNSAEFLKFDKEPIKTHFYCEEKSNCYYKQLQRKTAECETLKLNQCSFENCLNLGTFIQEIASLKTQLRNEKERYKQYNASKQASYEAIQKKANNLLLENRRVKIALDEIEDYMRFGLYSQNEYIKTHILDIINKAKG